MPECSGETLRSPHLYKSSIHCMFFACLGVSGKPPDWKASRNGAPCLNHFIAKCFFRVTYGPNRAPFRSLGGTFLLPSCRLFRLQKHAAETPRAVQTNPVNF